MSDRDSQLTGGPAPQPVTGQPESRPVDVDTASWLWLMALPLMITSYLAANIGDWQQAGSKAQVPLWMVVGVNGFIVAVIGALVITGVFLMRSGYRWARVALTAGAVGSVIYVVSRIFSLEGTPAVVQAISGITAAVLVCGGLYLVHRPDSTKYLIR